MVRFMRIHSCCIETHLQWGEVMVDQKSQSSYWNYEELQSKSVMVSIIGGLKFHIDQVNRGISTSDVDDLLKEKYIYK